MECDHVDAVLFECGIKPITAIRPIAYEMVQFNREHVAVETELD